MPKEEDKHHEPEFIYLEPEEEGFRFDSASFKQTVGKMQAKRYSLVTHVICFVLAIVTALILVVVLPIVLFFIALNLLTFCKFPDLNRNTKNIWIGFKKLLVVTIGLIFAVFSPAFGLSMITLYLMMQSDRFGNDLIKKFMERGK